MAFDASVMAFGLSRVPVALNLASTLTTYSILSIVVILNAVLLYRFFSTHAAPTGNAL